VDNPLVSAVIAVYDGEQFLAEAIDSILAQTYEPVEVIVVDDGSTDGSAGIARAYKQIRYVFQAHRGHPAALNTGIEAATGELIAFLDADDLWMPDKLSLQIPYLIEHPDVGYALALLRNFVEPGAELPPRPTQDLLVTDQVLLTVGTLVARRDVFESVGLFATDYVHGYDVDWFVRAKEAGVAMGIVRETCLLRRLHGRNMSFDREARRFAFAKVLRSAIDRRRARSSPREEDAHGPDKSK
jgi:glycosyltransferase involved in cell wall biosynthesis